MTSRAAARWPRTEPSSAPVRPARVPDSGDRYATGSQQLVRAEKISAETIDFTPVRAAVHDLGDDTWGP
jgi:hypothetical protein